MRSFLHILLITVVTAIIGVIPNIASASSSTSDAKAFSKLQQHIFEAERKTGVKAELITAIASIESRMGRNTNNKLGVMQYTSRTWRSDLRKHRKQLGLSANASARNPRANILVGAAALADNKTYLERKTRKKITPGDVYMSHFLGLYGAESVIKGKPNAPISRYVKLHKGNYRLYRINGKIATVSQFRAKMNSYVKREQQRYQTTLNRKRMDHFMLALQRNAKDHKPLSTASLN